MNSEQAVQRLKEWIAEVLPELLAIYDHVPAMKPGGLPDCVVESARTGLDDLAATRFRFWRIQQRNVYYVEASISFMVDNADTEAAAAQLRDFESRLLRSVLEDATLGGRVPIASPIVEFDFTAPFVEYEDGTKGREMTMTIAVGDLVEATT